jgi:nucleoside-diphosphate-sugar epimerase
MTEKTNSLHFLTDKKILVTGATGFIGSHLCRKLLTYDTKVHGISRNPAPQNQEDVYWWRGDLVDFEFMHKIMFEVKPDLIFHLGSHVAGSRSLDLVLPTFHSNLTSTVNLLALATQVGCHRIILAGSMEEPENGNHCAVPCSPYAAAKWASNGYARMFQALYQTPVDIARIFMVYGPGQNDLQKLIPYVILSLLRGEPPKLTSGHRQIDWIYVEDVVQGLIAMACASNLEGDSVDLGSGQLFTIQEVVKKLAEKIDPDIAPQFGSLPERPLEQVRIARVSESAAKIHWKPQISLDEGLERTISWYRKQIHGHR